MVKDFRIVLNAPPQGVFFSRSEVSGMLVVQVDEPKSYKNIKVSLIGQARVRWTEGYDNHHRHEYTSNQIYVKASTIVWTKEQVPSQELHIGVHNFRFRCKLPARLPSSFQGWFGAIEYYVEGRIDTGKLKFDHTVKVPITVVGAVDVDTYQLRSPLNAEKQKTLRCLMCASAPISLSVELPRRGFCYRDIIPLKVTLENGSNRQLRLRAQLLQVVVFTADDNKHERTQKVVANIASGHLEPRTTSMWNPEELVVPGHIEPTLTDRSCGIITIEYFLKVSAIVPWGLNLTVDIAITIGNVPLHSSTSAPNPLPMMVQPQLVSPQPTSSMYPTQGPPSHQPPQFGPGSPAVRRGDFQSVPPPSYEDVVANPVNFD